MRLHHIILSTLLLFSIQCFSQANKKITTVDFVQVLDDNMEEAIFYYQNNWKVLRDSAMAKGYIDSYEWMETAFTEEAPFHFMLKTTYASQAQFDVREEKFGELIEERGERKLLNEKQPTEFRKIIFWKEPIKHLE